MCDCRTMPTATDYTTLRAKVQGEIRFGNVHITKSNNTHPFRRSILREARGTQRDEIPLAEIPKERATPWATGGRNPRSYAGIPEGLIPLDSPRFTGDAVVDGDGDV